MRPKSIMWGHMGKKWVWKMPGEGLTDRLVQQTVKFGGDFLMIWGCMSWECNQNWWKDGCWPFHQHFGWLTSRINQVLQEKAIWCSLSAGQWPQTQEQEGPKMASRQWIWIVVWPPQSADVHLIEHLWHHLKTRLRDCKRPILVITELWERVQKKWEAIPASVCQNLILSMPRRV